MFIFSVTVGALNGSRINQLLLNSTARAKKVSNEERAPIIYSSISTERTLDDRSRLSLFQGFPSPDHPNRGFSMAIYYPQADYKGLEWAIAVRLGMNEAGGVELNSSILDAVREGSWQVDFLPIEISGETTLPDELNLDNVNAVTHATFLSKIRRSTLSRSLKALIHRPTPEQFISDRPEEINTAYKITRENLEQWLLRFSV